MGEKKVLLEIGVVIIDWLIAACHKKGQAFLRHMVNLAPTVRELT